MGKSENQHLQSHCRFDKTFTEMFLEWSSTKYIFFVITSEFDWLPWQPKGKICKTNIKKILRSCVGNKAKLYRIVSNISFNKKKKFLLLLFKHFGFYGNLKFPLTYNWKSENCDLLLSHCRYFDKSFTEMFVEWSSTKHIILVQTSLTLVVKATLNFH